MLLRSCADAHRAVGVSKFDAKLLHSLDTLAQTLEDVVEDDQTPFVLLGFAKALLGVNQAHLLEDRRLPALAGTCVTDMSLATVGFVDRSFLPSPPLPLVPLLQPMAAATSYRQDVMRWDLDGAAVLTQ